MGWWQNIQAEEKTQGRERGRGAEIASKGPMRRLRRRGNVSDKPHGDEEETCGRHD